MVPAKSMPRTMSLDSWSVRLQARTRVGFDGANTFGVSAAATDGADALDRVKPPQVPGPWVRANFVLRNASQELYRSDVRSAAHEGNLWELEVRSEAESEAVTLELVATSRLPADLGIRLLDEEQGTTVDLLQPGGELGRYTIVGRGPVHAYRLKILAGTAEYLETAGGAIVELPARVVLDLGPNPFKEAARIRFGLPRATQASLSIYDVRGQRVAELRRGEKLAPGYYVSVWHGTDTAGRELASGVYFCRIEASATTLTKRIVLLR